MPEHLIRLRGAWEQHDAAGSRRVDLPTIWAEGLAAPLTLTRRFRRPPIDPDGETVALRLESVPGLVSVRLNGVELAGREVWPQVVEIPLNGLREGANLLSLEVDPSGFVGEAWGAIGLVIRGA